MKKHEKNKVIFGPTKEISTLKYVLLILLFSALPSAIVLVLAYDVIYNFLHSFVLSVSLSALISSTLGAILSTYLDRYLMRRGIRPPGIRKKEARIKYIISPESGQPIDEKVIKRYEKALEFSDKESENYIAELAMLGMMYLQNAVAYDNKDLYLRAKEYLSRAEEAMQGKSVSFETKVIVDNLRSKIETYKYRFGER
ncbi:hypothetical protein [Saccharolobus caldissimus]|uniref:Uncharacterized protein n=1 Tax=Saccharolobus caldissimus TaxID=1702097 RepID=A0AAQ4CNM7_9CREN|nr:hypothetical protein [Saccharolobus caldissimus]BDB97408.1 hypothetical protein SACC_04250 [Saccharolobus caldissimus]